MKKVLAIILALLIAGGCGGSDSAAKTVSPDPSGDESTDTTVSESAETTSAPDEVDADATTTTVQATTQPPDAAPVGEAGSFTVNGEEFAVTMLNRCIPFFEGPDNVDLQALGQRTQLNLTVLSGMLDVSVQGSAIEEMFGSISFASEFLADGFEVTDDRFTGSATVTDALGSGETVDLSWDVQLPSEVRDCSL